MRPGRRAPAGQKTGRVECFRPASFVLWGLPAAPGGLITADVRYIFRISSRYCCGVFPVILQNTPEKWLPELEPADLTARCLRGMFYARGRAFFVRL